MWYCCSLLFVSTDILAGILYAGYSFTNQAVSELFAIGTPTSHFVVPLFTLYSVLLVAFTLGIWISAGLNHALRVMALMMIVSAVNGLVLWNFFPMHMRGAEMTFTDTMHVTLAGVGALFGVLTVGVGGCLIPKLVPLVLDRHYPDTRRACHFGIFVRPRGWRKPAYSVAWAY